jgi:hypothetical protein
MPINLSAHHVTMRQHSHECMPQSHYCCLHKVPFFWGDSTNYRICLLVTSNYDCCTSHRILKVHHKPLTPVNPGAAAAEGTAAVPMPLERGPLVPGELLIVIGNRCKDIESLHACLHGLWVSAAHATGEGTPCAK